VKSPKVSKSQLLFSESVNIVLVAMFLAQALSWHRCLVANSHL